MRAQHFAHAFLPFVARCVEASCADGGSLQWVRVRRAAPARARAPPFPDACSAPTQEDLADALAENGLASARAGATPRVTGERRSSLAAVPPSGESL